MKTTKVTRTSAEVHIWHLPPVERIWLGEEFGEAIDLTDAETDAHLADADLGGVSITLVALPEIVRIARDAGADELIFSEHAPVDSTLPVYNRRAHAYLDVVDEYPPQDTWDREDLDTLDQFCLIELSRYGGYWISTHASRTAAAAAHDGQEYVEDWDVVALVDLDSGDEYTAETVTVTTFS
jgi:hypothetical protein